MKKKTLFNLSNKVAVITGAAGLLGQSHVIALSQLECNVIATDISNIQINKLKIFLNDYFPQFKNKVCFKKMDVTKESSINNCIKYCHKKFGRIDILVNNAAYNPSTNKLNKNSLLENFSLNQWNRDLNVGLTGVFLTCKNFSTYMYKKNYNTVILNIASDLSVISPDQRLYSKNIRNKESAKPISYSAIKSGVHGITKYISTYYPGSKLRCNSLSPGGIYDFQSKDFVKKISKLIPMSIMADKFEYIGVVQFLCSDSSIYLNGQNIVMDGGRSVW